MRKVNIIAAVLLLALSGFVLATTRSFPQGQGTLGPAFFPNLVAGLLIAFSLALLWQVFRGADQEAPAAPRRQTLWVMVAVIAYVVLLPILGFLVATPALLVITGLLLAESAQRWWKPVLASSVVTTAVLYLLFVQVLHVPLP